MYSFFFLIIQLLQKMRERYLNPDYPHIRNQVMQIS